MVVVYSSTAEFFCKVLFLSPSVDMSDCVLFRPIRTLEEQFEIYVINVTGILNRELLGTNKCFCVLSNFI